MNQAKISTESDILIAGTVGEEGLGDLRGIKHIFKPGNQKIDSHIALDGGDISGLVTNGLGSVRYKITLMAREVIHGVLLDWLIRIMQWERQSTILIRPLQNL
jgi:hypothetical protein